MNLETISYIIEDLYYNGVVKSNSRQLTRNTILEYCKLGYANVMRNLWFTFKKQGFGNEQYFFTGSLTRKIFDLGEVDKNGRRCVDISNYPIIRLPKNMHIFSVRPINEINCNSDLEIATQVMPGEVNFYTNDTFNGYSFFCLVGNSIDCYNIPDCIKKVEVEAVWDNSNADIPNDIAADVIKYILIDLFKVKQISIDKIDDNNPNEIIQQIKNKLKVSNPQ